MKPNSKNNSLLEEEDMGIFQNTLDESRKTIDSKKIISTNISNRTFEQAMIETSTEAAHQSTSENKEMRLITYLLYTSKFLIFIFKTIYNFIFIVILSLMTYFLIPLLKEKIQM